MSLPSFSPKIPTPDFFQISQLMSDDNTETSPFAVLPEDFVAKIISFTSPKDACAAAAVSLGFKSAADSDAVWERFLPPDYREIVAESSSPVNFSTKKELYFLLCNSPLLIHGGKLSLALSRSTGKKCYLLCARELQIAWIENPIHWEFTSLPESRFAEVAELLNVCWLDICGVFKARMLSPNTAYVAYLVFKLAEENYGLECSSNASVKSVGENGPVWEGESTTVHIVPPAQRRVMRRRRWVLVPETNIEGRVPQSRTNGWLEIELGQVFIDEGDDSDVHVRLSETLHLNWKRGLLVEGIELRPKEAF